MVICESCRGFGMAYNWCDVVEDYCPECGGVGGWVSAPEEALTMTQPSGPRGPCTNGSQSGKKRH